MFNPITLASECAHIPPMFKRGDKRRLTCVSIESIRGGRHWMITHFQAGTLIYHARTTRRKGLDWSTLGVSEFAKLPGCSPLPSRWIGPANRHETGVDERETEVDERGRVVSGSVRLVVWMRASDRGGIVERSYQESLSRVALLTAHKPGQQIIPEGVTTW